MKKQNSFKTQNGIIIGNIEDKENIKNPIAKWLVNKFDNSLIQLCKSVSPKSIHEVGCGEGRLTQKLSDQFCVPMRASDFGEELIKHNLLSRLPNVTFVQKNIYDLSSEDDYADLIVCCEVLEHLEYPEKGIDVLKNIKAQNYIFSVPREPMWGLLNSSDYE